MKIDPAATRDNELSAACVALRAGKDGLGQTTLVRRHLLELELAELAHYARKGWRLTPAGKERAKAFARAAKKGA